MAYVAVNGARLWVEEEGQGPAVVFLHGGLGDLRLFEPQAHALADAFRCIRYDLRFYGRSEGPAEEWSSIDDAVGLLDELGVERAALIGLSLGGGLALDTALAHPGRVWAIASYVDGVTGMPISLDPELEARYDAAEGDQEKEMAIDFEIWAPLGTEPLYRELWLATPDARGLPDGARPRPRPDAQLENLSVPTLVVTAKLDPPSLQENARRIPGAQRVEVDSDHYLTLREPERVTKLIRDFLAATAPQQ